MPTSVPERNTPNGELPQDEKVSTMFGAPPQLEDCDAELKAIFVELNKLSGERPTSACSEPEDVESILKKAKELSIESQRSPLFSRTRSTSMIINTSLVKHNKVPQIKVTKPRDENNKKNDSNVSTLVSKDTSLTKTKENPKDIRRKSNVRPFSASFVESKRKENSASRTTPFCSPKKALILKHEQVAEELKNTNERVKTLEIQNVKLVEDAKTFRTKFEEANEENHLLQMKLAECEKFIGRLGKEYESNKCEISKLKEIENKLLEDLTKEKNDRKNMNLHHEKDRATIQDLQRQCREMELILKRKHPDSVSALIVASRSSSIEDSKRKLLEERIMHLESELSDKENNFQNLLGTLQEKFSSMKQKYEAHIIDVERQLMDDRKVNSELKNKISRVNMIDACVQADERNVLQHASTQTFFKSTERLSSAVSRLSQNSSIIFSKLREDSYLIATIKGLQTELTSKQRIISKINRETEELRKSLRNMQKEKEVMNNFQSIKKSCSKGKSMENLLSRINTELETEIAELRQHKDALAAEKDSLMLSFKRTNEEFIALKKKRIQDLHTLQLSHEKELMQMNLQLFPLQEEVNILNRTVEIDVLKRHIRSIFKASAAVLRQPLPGGHWLLCGWTWLCQHLETLALKIEHAWRFETSASNADDHNLVLQAKLQLSDEQLLKVKRPDVYRARNGLQPDPAAGGDAGAGARHGFKKRVEAH